jgi:2-methylisocitrate lyase-like PEP mutase family enzyme
MHPRLAVTREVMLDRARDIAAAVQIPVNADLEDGYGRAPEAVAETVHLSIEMGLAGGNIEDHDPAGDGRLYDESLAVERIRAGRQAIDACGSAFVLNAKIDAYTLEPREALRASIRRGNLFREAGADCVYPCGVTDLGAVRTLVQEIDAPVNVVIGWGGPQMRVGDLLDAGVSRISLGGSLARAALGYLRTCARALRDHGSIGFASAQIPQSELNDLFAGRAATS